MQVDDNFLEFKNNIFIHKSAKIGENVKIDPFVFIGKNVEILDYSKISSHTVIGSEPEILGESGSNFTVLIGKNVTVREFVTIHAGFKKNTIIENDVYVMNHSHIAHDCYIKKNAIISPRADVTEGLGARSLALQLARSSPGRNAPGTGNR